MLTAEELAAIPGVTIGDGSDPETLSFSVAVHGYDPAADADPTANAVIPITLEVRCPLSRGRPLFDHPRTRLERRGGGVVPADWRAGTLGARLAAKRDAELTRTALERARHEQLGRQSKIRTAREQSRVSLAKAAEQFVAGLDPAPADPAHALPEFLAACGHAFLAALIVPKP